MNFEEVNYKVKAYTTNNTERTLTENDIRLYYETLGYNVYHNYYKRIKSNEFILSPSTVDLFNIYKNGYPDFMLISIANPEIIKFVEVKLDNDAIRPNQVDFNNKLALLEDVTIAYFNNKGRYTNKEDITYVSKLPKGDKDLIKRLDGIAYIQKRKKYKPYWVVSELYKEFGSLILKKNNTGIIANKLNLKKDNIVWFIKTNLIKNK